MRYIIGIDLGTTNCSAAYVDTAAQNPAIQQFRIPQLVSEGYVEACTTLPSFCYLASGHEWPEGSIALPWKREASFFVGAFAQVQGAKVPTRLVQSAKSWLCHPGANRREKILPFEAADDARRISPVEASARYLAHIKEAWNHAVAQGDPALEFEQQDIVLTVPASFDEVARRLTAEAAAMAGLAGLTLLEEPQAAFYSWISQHEGIWRNKLPHGSMILVCDVGGGTADFSLIEVAGSPEQPSFQRMAVGDHLLLGGDNMDAAIAHDLEKKHVSGELNTQQWLQLRHQARSAKEALLKEPSPQQFRIVLQGTGSSVVQDSRAFEVGKEHLQRLLLDGFFGTYDWDEALNLIKGSGIRSMGLPYEEEPSIVKHLAQFLYSSAGDDKIPKKPDFVLFNGGAMKPPAFQQAILQSLERWFPAKKPQVLPSYHLDLAVARGAAYYGKARRGLGVRISGGTARGCYLALDIKSADGALTRKAMTLLPRGAEEGSSFEPRHTFWLMPNSPVQFQMFTSHVRLHDAPGQLIDIDAKELHPLPPIHTLMRFGKAAAGQGNQEKIPVHLGIHLTAIGTLELWLQSEKTDHRWSLEFQLRTASGHDACPAAMASPRTDETFDKCYSGKAQQAIQDFFAGRQNSKAEKLMETLEQLLDRPRRDWPPSLLRGLWEPLLEQAPRRKASPDLEARWWNLAGFLLRPGFGFPLDDFRLKELWKIILGDLKASKSLETRIQNWICYRRIAGGLNKGQQMQLASELLPSVINKQSGRIDLRNKGDQYQYAEKIRALAAMELVEIPLKAKLGNALVERLSAGNGISADYWALARLGSRHLFYGSIANVVPHEICSKWVEKLLAIKNADREQLAFVLGQLARKSGHREINLPQHLINQVIKSFEQDPIGERLNILLVQETGLTQTEQEQIFGDRLPAGLEMRL